MKNTDFTIGGFVRITMDGSFENVPYRTGEIWQVVKHVNVQCIRIERNSQLSTVYVTHNAPRIECEFIGMEKPIEEPNYQIY